MSTLAERSRRAVWHPCTQMKRLEREPLLAIARAEGSWLIDVDGKRYLDAVSSWWVNLFGHGHPRIRAALAEQLATLDHVMLAGLTHEPVVSLSERLAALTGLGHAFYASDGASATEIALKMSAHAWRNAGRAEKCEFVGLAGGYHGETVGALSVTDIALFREAYAPLVRLSAALSSPDARRAEPGEDAASFARRTAGELEAYLERHHERTAAFIVEPLVQCAAGFAMHDAEYLRQARRLCDRYQVHLICDEIAVGFGRTGSLFAHSQAGIRPDFLCLSKGLTGGTLPLSVVLTTDAVYDAFYDDRAARGFLHSHSYTGNPLACRAALAVLDLFAEGLDGTPVLERNRASAARLTALCEPLSAHPRVLRARRLGMLWAWDIDDAGIAGFSGAYHLAAREQGLLLRPIGNTLYFMPPYVLDEPALEQLASGALRALHQVLAPRAAAGPPQGSEALQAAALRDATPPRAVHAVRHGAAALGPSAGRSAKRDVGAVLTATGWFVTGTDTGVGKTRASCALLHALRARHARCIGMKPVAAGCDADGDNDDARELRAAGSISAPAALANPVRLRDAVSPHIAARNVGVTIDIDAIVGAYRALAQQADAVVVEGAGGFLVPLSERHTGADLAAALGLPIILVVGLRLGCLNHALLTRDAILQQGLPLAGWIANRLDPAMPEQDANVAYLRERLETPLLADWPCQPLAQPASLRFLRLPD